MVLKETNMSMVRPFLVASIATLVAVIATFSVSGGWASAQEGGTGTGPIDEPGGTGPSPEVPEGQLVRRGLSGYVTEIGGSSFVVETKFGNVLVLVDENTIIKEPPQGEVDLDELEVGDRVGVLLQHPELDDAAGTGDDSVIRTATALKVMIVPSKATRQHQRAIVLEKVKDAVKDKIRFLNEDGEEVEIETEVEIEGEEGDEVVLITRSGGKGRPDHVAAAADAEKIEQRLAKLAEKRAEIEEKIQKVRERVNAQRAARLAEIDIRISDSDNIDEEIKARIAEARARAQAKAEEARAIAQAKIEAANVDAQARIEEARAKAEERIQKAREEAEERIQKARERAEDRAANAQARAAERIEKAKSNSGGRR